MTLPLRKKLPITVQNIHSRARAVSRQARRGLLAAALVAAGAGSVSAQTAAWQPSRLPPAPAGQPLSSGSLQSGSLQSGSLQSGSLQSGSLQSARPQVGRPQVGQPAASGSVNQAAATASGVQLRWRASSRALGDGQPAPSHLSSASAVYEQSSAPQAAGQTAAARAAADRSSHLANEAWLANPLRDSGAAQSATRQTYAAARIGDTEPSRPTAAQASGVRMAAYQPPAGDAQLQGSAELPQPKPQFQPPSLPQSQPQPMPTDPLTQPELPPTPPGNANAPGLELPGTLPAQPSFQAVEPTQPQIAPPPAGGLSSPFNRTTPESTDNTSPSDRGNLPDNSQPYSAGADSPAGSDEDEFDQLGRRKSRADAMLNCETFRDNLRNATLDKVNLNSAPRFGQGLEVDEQEGERMRSDFAANSEVRDWCDREGRTLVRGRMIDLRNEQVVLDIDGARREIPLRDLCDVDMAYIGKAWNLPVSCGSGYQVVAGRGFVPSAMQWKASGLCHKPLYFEEVQLERYGHEIGPLLQPVVSTVHFFGNIAVLPYKMGIHPPHECQHALGYYRPGDCAPYMLPPIPISLRGAAVQAGAVVGASALIP